MGTQPGVISQRELRNDNAEVIRRVQNGETLTVTRNGVPVASISPAATFNSVGLRPPLDPASDILAIPAVRAPLRTEDVLEELRAEG